MERDDGEAHASAGQDCPAQKPIGATNEITINGERLRIVQATDEEGAAIIQCLKERAESAPAGARIGRASALVRSGLRGAAIILLAVGVGIGLGDGNVFDDVGCSVAQQPRRASHDADSGQARADGNGTDKDSGLTIEDGRERRAECVARAEMCVNRQPDGRCRTTMQPCRLFVGVDDIRAMMAEVRAGVVGLAMGPPTSGNSESGKRKVKPERSGKHPTSNIERPTSNGKHGRFRFENGFLDVWVGGEHYDLRGRAKARLCIQYLVAKQAFDENTARHLENEIDPFVRKKCQLPPPSEIRIQHYFNDRSGKLSRLRSDLVKAAGRNGRFFLQVI